MNLLMTREVAGKLSRDLILDEDIEALIRYCEQTQQFLLDEQTGRRIGHLRRGYITYWNTHWKTAAGGSITPTATECS